MPRKKYSNDYKLYARINLTKSCFFDKLIACDKRRIIGGNLLFQNT